MCNGYDIEKEIGLSNTLVNCFVFFLLILKYAFSQAGYSPNSLFGTYDITRLDSI